MEPIEQIRQAIETFSEEVRFPGEGRVVSTAVVIFETSRVDDDGNVNYSTNYAIVTESSIASAIGNVDIGSALMMEDATYQDDED